MSARHNRLSFRRPGLVLEDAAALGYLQGANGLLDSYVNRICVTDRRRGIGCRIHYTAGHNADYRHAVLTLGGLRELDIVHDAWWGLQYIEACKLLLTPHGYYLSLDPDESSDGVCDSDNRVFRFARLSLAAWLR